MSKKKKKKKCPTFRSILRIRFVLRSFTFDISRNGFAALLLSVLAKVGGVTPFIGTSRLLLFLLLPREVIVFVFRGWRLVGLIWDFDNLRQRKRW